MGKVPIWVLLSFRRALAMLAHGDITREELHYAIFSFVDSTKRAANGTPLLILATNGDTTEEAIALLQAELAVAQEQNRVVWMRENRQNDGFIAALNEKLIRCGMRPIDLAEVPVPVRNNALKMVESAVKKANNDKKEVAA